MAAGLTLGSTSVPSPLSTSSSSCCTCCCCCLFAGEVLQQGCTAVGGLEQVTNGDTRLVWLVHIRWVVTLGLVKLCCVGTKGGVGEGGGGGGGDGPGGIEISTHVQQGRQKQHATTSHKQAAHRVSPKHTPLDHTS
jgi:hypothetical protein